MQVLLSSPLYLRKTRGQRELKGPAQAPILCNKYSLDSPAGLPVPEPTISIVSVAKEGG